MSFIIKPWQLMVSILAGWVNRQQQAAIEFQRAEIQTLLELLGKKRLLLNNDQRRRLAVKGNALVRKGLLETGSLITPDTILRWHRRLVAQKWTCFREAAFVGRPAVAADIQKLIVQVACENPTWGYDRIQGALANLGHELSVSTVGNILRAHGIRTGARTEAHDHMENASQSPLGPTDVH